MRIDAHQHFWRLNRGDYAWLTPAHGQIYRDYLPADLKPHLAEARIEKAIAVQAAPTVAETEFLLGLAQKTDWIGGIVGWVDMEASDAAETLTRLARDPAFLGIRPMIQSIGDDEWILRQALTPVFDALAIMGLTFDALVLPRHLPHLLKRLAQHPNLRCVINHCAKPELDGGDLGQWSKNIKRIAIETNAAVKFSGLTSRAGPEWAIEQLKPAADTVLDAFGASRVMFASDWPVLNKTGGYGDWVHAATRLTQSMNAQDKHEFWGGTAARYYRLE